MAAAGANPPTTGVGSSSDGVDQNLYSRQIGVFGMETMGKLIQMNVLLVGLRGVGVETAKNLILAGPRSVTLYDPEPVRAEDLGYNYYLSEKDIGKERAEASMPQLSELNSYVQVSVLPEKELSEDVLARFHVVVCTGQPVASLVRFNDFCRNRDTPIGFIAADVRGLAGRAFVDFGDRHKVIDPDGEPTREAIVVGVVEDKNKEGQRVITVQCHDSKRHGFSDGDHVVFRELDGADELADGTPRRIVNCGKYSFEIDPEFMPGSITPYKGNGVAAQVKMPQPVAFASLQERIRQPVPSDDPMGALLTPDLGKFGRPDQLHAAFQGLDAFAAKHGGAMPKPHDADDIAAVTEAAQTWARDNAAAGGAEIEVDAKIVKLVSQYADVELPALCAFYGGVIAQEVVKFTGKFSPLRQWLYLDAFELAPNDEQLASLGADEFKPSNDRYDFSRVIFGRSFTERIQEQQVFVVGAGALGCEFLKNYALMGVGTRGSGRIVVTDMDNIEVSNLNRQFLFRSKDVGAPKSTTAAVAAMAMNPDLKDRIVSLETAVGPDTEKTFNETFWRSLNFVTNALDNLKARTYVDEQCVWFGLPLLESGTLGTKANTQVVVPHLTESYADAVDPPEESIPMCTLKNFPNAIEHCIEWSRDNFEGYFTSAPQDAKAFCTNPAKWLADASAERNDYTRRHKLESVKNVLEAAKKASWHTCVAQARTAFEEDYASQIKQLLHNFPADHLTSEGAKFWSGPKRMPSPAIFDLANPLHRRYVAEAAALFASVYSVPIPTDYHSVGALKPTLSEVDIPEWKPKAVKIKAGDDDNTVEGGQDDSVVAKNLTDELSAMADSSQDEFNRLAAQLNPAEFEKDDDSNHHVDFISASANLRAANYSIGAADRHKVKMIAGKIIPAIATTTCMVTGLVMIEAYKIMQQMALAPKDRCIEPFRNSFINLGVNVYSMSEPGEPKRVVSTAMDPIMGCPVRAVPERHSKWDRFLIGSDKGVRTVRELMDYVRGEIARITEEEQREEEDKAAAASSEQGAGSAKTAKPDGVPSGPLKPEDMDVTMVLAGNKMLYSNLYPSHKTRLDRKLAELYAESLGPLDKPSMSLSLSVETADGAELAIPPLQLFVS